MIYSSISVNIGHAKGEVGWKCDGDVLASDKIVKNRPRCQNTAHELCLYRMSENTDQTIWDNSKYSRLRQ